MPRSGELQFIKINKHYYLLTITDRESINIQLQGAAPFCENQGSPKSRFGLSSSRVIAWACRGAATRGCDTTLVLLLEVTGATSLGVEIFGLGLSLLEGHFLFGVYEVAWLEAGRIAVQRTVDLIRELGPTNGLGLSTGRVDFTSQAELQVLCRASS